MNDNIRNKAIFKTKLQKKCLKTTKIWHFEKITVTLHNWNVFATTTKKFGDSTMFSYWDMDQTKHTF